VKKNKLIRNLFSLVITAIIINSCYSIGWQGSSLSIKKNEAYAETSNGYIYYAYKYSNGSKIYKMAPDGSSSNSIYSFAYSMDIRDMVTSPDGNWIYLGYKHSSGITIYKISTNGGSSSQIFNMSSYDADIRDIEISPDGNWIYLGYKHSSGITIYKISTNGGSSSNVFNMSSYYADIRDIEISPDGNWIYLGYKHSSGITIYKISTNGGSSSNVFNMSSYYADIRDIEISPDGNWIYFAIMHSDGSIIYKRDTNGENNSYMYNTSSTSVHIKDMIISPDGNWVYFTYKHSSGSSIYRVKNDGTNHSFIISWNDDIIILNQVVNNNPTINSTNPAVNQIFTESNTSFSPAITVQDVDNDTLTCKYYIDSEATARDAITATGTSTAKTVTFNAMNMAALSEGSHTIKFTVNDGLAVTEKSVTFKVDKSSPAIGTVTVTSSTNSITVSGSATDNIAGLDTYPYRYTIGPTVTGWLTGTSYTQASLSPNTSYAVKFEARDAVGHIATYTGSIYTKAEVPSVTVSTPTFSSLKVTVSDSNPSSTQYQIKTGSYYVTQTGALSTSAQWITLSSKNITVTGLSPNTNYSFTAKAKNGQGVETSQSAAASGTTLPLPPSAPGTPTTVSTANSIAVYWNSVTGATGYDLLSDGVLIQNVTSPYTHSGLPAGTSHTYQVRAKNAGGTSAWSTQVTGWTIPGTPTGITAASTSGSSITITWPAVTGASGYDLEADGVLIQNVTSQYTHTGLSPNTQHTYRVRAKNTGGTGGYSTAVAKYTLANIPSGGTIGTITGTGIEASWSANGNPQGTQYALAAFTTDDVLVKQNPWTTALNSTITGLSPESSYRIKVKAKNGDGNETSWYEIGSAQTLPNPPGIPSGIAASSEETRITVTWLPVDGATGYDIMKDGVQVDNVVSPYEDTGLLPGTEHTYRLRAKNAGGASEWSSPISVSTKLSVPDNIIASAEDDKITLTWDPVEGASIYKVEIDSSQVVQTAGNQYTHTGLAPYSIHTYRIKAENPVSSSDWSSEISKMTKAVPPAVPTGLSSEKTDSWIKITWNPVSGASGYEVKADGNTINVGNDTEYLDMGLVAGTEHTYQVRARNSAGKSDWSSPYTVSTEAVSSNTPSGLTALVSDTSIVVTWDDVPGADAYILEADDEYISVTDAVYNHIGLSPGSEHSYRVRSETDGNLSDWSERLTVRTFEDPDALPDKPQNITYLVSQTEILLSWERVNGALSYDIEMDGVVIDSTISNSYEVDSLEEGRSYIFRIRAVNKNGPGEWSDYITASTLEMQSGLPPVPKNITWSSTKNSVTLIWDFVENADSFDVEMDGQLIDNVSVTAFVYSGLQSNTTYSFRIRGVNREGTGDWSSVVETATKPQAPSIPENITFTATQTSITLTWDAVEGASTYEIEEDGIITGEISNTNYTHSQLVPGTQHAYRIRARNAGGTSDWSSQKIILTPTGTAGVPENLSVSATDTSVTLTWDVVSGADSYEVEIDSSSIQSVTQAVYNHQDITPGTMHSYRVRAVTAGNPGAWSAQVSISTMLSVPSDFSAVPGDSLITLTWDAVPGVSDYELEIDGETLLAVRETSYIHTNLMPGSEHTYRLRARSGGAASLWTEPVVGRAQSLTYTSSYSSGEEFEIVFAAQNVSDFSETSFIIEYNPEEMELLDLCAATPSKDPEDGFTEGLIQGTDIYLESFTDGAIRFKANKAVAPGQVWSGIVNRMRFMAKTSGDLTITYAVQ